MTETTPQQTQTPAEPLPVAQAQELPARIERKPPGPFRVAAKMSLRYLFICVLLAAARAVVPIEIFSSWPPLWMSALESAPLLIAGIIMLNLSLPRGILRPWEYVPALVLTAAAVAGYDALRGYLSVWFPSITDGIDIWALEAIPLYALRPLILGGALMAAFTLIWSLSFGLPTRRFPRLYRLLSPLLWALVASLCLAVAYFHMVNYAQVHEGAVIGMLLNRGAPQSAAWYHLDPLSNLIIHWIATPLELVLMGVMILAPMRMLRRGYPAC